MTFVEFTTEDSVITTTPFNGTKEIPWVEQTISGGLRIWQVLFLAGGAIMTIVILMCCCFRIRIPRTKQEIDADFRRKQLTKRFKQELKRIRNSELDVLDLKRALDRVRADFHSDTESYCGNHSDILSTMEALQGGNSPGDKSPADTSDLNLTQQWLEMQMSKLKSGSIRGYTAQRV